MLNVAELDPCPRCKSKASMLMPAKGDNWFLVCSRSACSFRTETYEDVEDARTEWETTTEATAIKKVTVAPKRVAAPKTKGINRAAAVRERVQQYIDKGKNPVEQFDSLLDFAMSLGFNTRGAAVACVKVNTKKILED